MDYKVNKIKLSAEEVLQKMRNWCVYQERSQQEVRRKASEFNLAQEEIEEIISMKSDL